MTDPSPRLLRRPDVRARTGLSDTRIDELEARGRFPRRVRISERAIGWVESEINDFITARIAERDGANATSAAWMRAQEKAATSDDRGRLDTKPKDNATVARQV